MRRAARASRSKDKALVTDARICSDSTVIPSALICSPSGLTPLSEITNGSKSDRSTRERSLYSMILVPPIDRSLMMWRTFIGAGVREPLPFEWTFPFGRNCATGLTMFGIFWSIGFFADNVRNITQHISRPKIHERFSGEEAAGDRNRRNDQGDEMLTALLAASPWW